MHCSLLRELSFWITHDSQKIWGKRQRINGRNIKKWPEEWTMVGVNAVVVVATNIIQRICTWERFSIVLNRVSNYLQCLSNNMHKWNDKKKKNEWNIFKATFTEKCLMSGLLDDKHDKKRLLHMKISRKNIQFVRHARRSHTKHE